MRYGLFPNLPRNADHWKVVQQIEAVQLVEVDQRSGVYDEFGRQEFGSVSAAETPLHVVPYELLHQLITVAFQEATKSIRKNLIEAVEPAALHQRARLSQELLWNFGLK